MQKGHIRHGCGLFSKVGEENAYWMVMESEREYCFTK